MGQPLMDAAFIGMERHAQFFEHRFKPRIDFLHGHRPLPAFCFGKAAGIPHGQCMGQMIPAPQHRPQQHRTAFMHQAQGRLRGSDIDNRHVAGNASPFFFQELADRKQRHSIDRNRRRVQIGGGHKPQMFSNLFFGGGSHEDIGPFGFRGSIPWLWRRQQQTADRDVLQRHGNQVFHFEGHNLR
jgi:hypothetical protein